MAIRAQTDAPPPPRRQFFTRGFLNAPKRFAADLQLSGNRVPPRGGLVAAPVAE